MPMNHHPCTLIMNQLTFLNDATMNESLLHVRDRLPPKEDQLIARSDPWSTPQGFRMLEAVPVVHAGDYAWVGGPGAATQRGGLDDLIIPTAGKAYFVIAICYYLCHY